MNTPLIERTEKRDYQNLFIRDLNWSRPDHAPVTIEYDDRQITATNVSSYKGLRVWVVNEAPDSKLEAALDRQLAQTSTDRILILHDADQQVWRWPVRRALGSTTTTRLSRHRHRNGDPDPRFAQKLETIKLPADATLDSTSVLAKVRQAFDVETTNETKHASRLMARLYTAMEKAYPSTTPPAVRDHEIAVTLARVLFLMFGDDTEMWRDGLLSDFVRDHTRPDGSDIGAQLAELFDYLDTTDATRSDADDSLRGFPYVNGRIFTERIELPVLNAEFRTAVLEACDRDWASISPAIFGSMFQSVRDAETRRQLGEHYTSEANILKTLNPLFLDELRAELEHIRTLGKYEADRLRKLRDKLGSIRYLDPACGCGNFIIVAYRELRDLELSIMERLQEITGEQASLLANLDLKVSLSNFFGIEVDEWPARIAETAMFLVDRQCDLKLNASLGLTPNRLPIKQQATIAVANALRKDWAEVLEPSPDVVIAGNPPFLGPHTRSKSQLADLQAAWGTRDLGRLDYVTGWYATALRYFKNTPGGRFALVSTSSITQGDQVARLFPPIFADGWRLRFAHQTFPWTSEAVGAAAVHCVITGFDKTNEPRPQLYEYLDGTGTPAARTVTNINPYLAAGPTVIVTPRTLPLSSSLARVTLGSMAKDGGNLVVEVQDYARFACDPIASKYLRPYIGSRELLHGGDRWCLWLEGMDPADARSSPLLAERIAAVRAFRIGAGAESTKEFASIPHLFTQRAAQVTSFVCIPRVSSENRPYLPCRRLDAEVIASDANYQVQDPDGLQFAILSSSMLLTWQKTIGGRLESRLRFAVRTVWNNLPLPPIGADQRTRIVEAGRAVEVARALQPGATLADLYDSGRLSPELGLAHRHLDELVDRAFGAGTLCKSELERQELLFERYTDLTSRLDSQQR